MTRNKAFTAAGLVLMVAGFLLISAYYLQPAGSVAPVVGLVPLPSAMAETLSPTRTPVPQVAGASAPSPAAPPATPTSTQVAGPSATAEVLIPTRTPAQVAGVSATAVALSPTRTPAQVAGVSAPSPAAPPATLTSARPALPGSSLWQGRTRWGIGVANGPLSRYRISEFAFGWYLNWGTAVEPLKPEGMEYVQMVRLTGGHLQPDETTLGLIARANPGSIWMVGNEPDVKWQDNVEPAVYARLYQRAWLAIKAADPTAQVAIGGVTEPTPLRLRYLDLVLEAYREQYQAEMPVDVWNVHNFILREERGSWGVDIPPGLEDAHGVLYTVDDSGSLALFQSQILGFRKWMAARGYQNRALIVSEYGIPMPEDYGFPPERVGAFLAATFDFFLTARDPELGDPSDEDRLVQRWCWFSLDDINYPTGRLFDPQTGEMTEVGHGLANLIMPGRGK